MDKMIILSDLSRSIAASTGCTIEDAENFLRELFSLAYSRLEHDGRVEIPEVGVFVNDGENIGFAPDGELASALNAPFAAFDAIELPDDYVEAESEVEREIAAAVEFEEQSDAEPVPEAEPEAVQLTESVVHESEQKSEEPMPEPQSQAEPDAATVAAHEDSVENVENKMRRGYAWLWWLPVCCLFFACGFILGQQRRAVAPSRDIVEDVSNDSVIEPSVADSITEVAAEVEMPIVTDTISANRFLTTMARAHYGQMEYWVYIYEANASKLGHPDRLEAGTVVIIPPAEKFNLKAGDEEMIKEASAKAVEIYSRFN